MRIQCYRKEIGERFFPYYLGKVKNIFKYIYNILKNMFKKSDLLYLTGSHIITGYQGSGKTLLTNYIINNFDTTKYFWYTNIDEFKQNNIKVIDIKELFREKKQVKRLATRDENGRVLAGVILDEINREFNKRVNQTREYTDLFIGLIEMVVSMRHQHIPRFYFIGQKLDLQDTQLISLYQYQHDIIRTRKRFRYWKYYQDKAQKIPTKSYVMHRLKALDEQGHEYFKDYKRGKYKYTWFDLESYNTFGMANEYKNLPEYKGKCNTNVIQM